MQGCGGLVVIGRFLLVIHKRRFNIDGSLDNVRQSRRLDPAKIEEKFICGQENVIYLSLRFLYGSKDPGLFHSAAAALRRRRRRLFVRCCDGYRGLGGQISQRLGRGDGRCGNCDSDH